MKKFSFSSQFTGQNYFICTNPTTIGAEVQNFTCPAELKTVSKSNIEDYRKFLLSHKKRDTNIDSRSSSKSYNLNMDWKYQYKFIFVEQSHSDVSLRPHGLQHARPPCPSPSPEVHPSSCSWHRCCRPAISSSDTLFSFCPQSFPASGTFPVSHLFESDDQNTGASASASVLPVTIQG